MLSWLEELDPGRSAAVGEKAETLGAMTRAGLPVPPGFVVEAAACQAHLEEAGLLGPIAERLRALAPDDLAAMEAACGAIAGRVEAAPVPAAVADAVVRAYAELERRTGERNPAVAVRSSAGQEELVRETVLGVRGTAALLDALRHCWAGPWAPGALAGRLRLNCGHRPVPVAVVVQAMVEPDVAGEIISLGPASGREDEYVVTAVYSPGESEGGRPLLSLTPEQRAELEGLALRVKELFGRPQQMEWMLTGGQFWLLQAGPAAEAGARPVGETVPRGCQPDWERAVARLKAQYPDPPRPLDLSVMEAMHRAVHPWLGQEGALVQELPDGSFAFVPGRARPGLGVLWRWPLRLLQAWRQDSPARWAALRDEMTARLEELSWPERSAAGLLEQARALVALLGEYQRRRVAPGEYHADVSQLHPVPLPSLGARWAGQTPARDEALGLMQRMVACLRQNLLALGAELTRRGRLARPDEIFYLRLEELDRVMEGTLASAPLVSRRRRAYARTCAAQERGLHWAEVGQES